MKRTNTFFIMAALLLAGISTIVSCTKDDEQPVEGKTYHMTITASKGGDNTKDLTINGTTISATWAEGETVTVYNVTKSADLTGTLAAQSSGASTTLKGSLTGTIEAGDKLLLKFCSPDYSMQDGTLAYIAANCDYAEATVTVASVNGGKITANDAAFENKQAIVKFTLKNTSDRAIWASALSVSVGGTIYAAVPTSASSELFVALPGISGQAVTLSAKVGSEWYNKTQANVTFVNGQYYTVTAKLEQKGMLPGTFSVASGSRVHFSQGNLQATYDGIWTWAFAMNQYDYVGNAAGNTSVINEDPYVNTYDFSGASGTVDLFGWVGASSNWGEVNEEDEEDEEDEVVGVNKYGITASTATNAVDGYGRVAGEALKADWGTLAISNGGNAENSGWYTCSKNDWQHLFESRSTSMRYARATVCGWKGVILFPDAYTHPTGVTPLAKTNEDSGYGSNIYNADAWAKMEAAGAVFLPAAGIRWRQNNNNNGKVEVQEDGRMAAYWSSTSSSAGQAYRLYVYDSQLRYDEDLRCHGYSVRLVRLAVE